MDDLEAMEKGFKNSRPLQGGNVKDKLALKGCANKIRIR